MVKINKTLGLALLTALAASCSSDNDVAGTSNPTIENGEANYATLKIDLPTRAGVRAVDFNDGLASEYTVNDATLLVFMKGTTDDEKDFTFVESVPLGNMNPWQKSSATGITTTANVTAELKKASLTDLQADKIYGLVILNNTAANGNKISIPSEGTTYSAWNVANSVTATNMTDISKGIVMANAPEWTTPGQAPTTLVLIHGDKVKPTKAQAEAAGAAADIHVERGLAKVTLDKGKSYDSEKGITITGENNPYADCTVKLDAWALDVTNRTSFPIHKTDGLKTSYDAIWNYDASATTAPTTNRFQDHTADFKRVYWGIDPNYDGNDRNVKGDAALTACNTAFNMVYGMTDDQKKTAFKTTFGDDNPQYCLENTFDIDNMTQGQTTRVLIKATFSIPASNITDPKNDTYQSGNNLYKINNDAVLYTSYQLAGEIAYYIQQNFGKKVTVKIDGTDIANTAGKHELADENFPSPTNPAKVFTRSFGHPGQATGVLTDDESEKVFKAFKITTYKDGACYYVGRIKHFGDDETPWNQGDPTYYNAAKSIDKATGNKKWLGRYGVLRNNWYSLSVGSVSAPGDPTIPQVVPENPDDDNFNYINLSVNVLQWAKRTDGFDL
jgi:hypothetical protein